jgi:hypothetical protein
MRASGRAQWRAGDLAQVRVSGRAQWRVSDLAQVRVSGRAQWRVGDLAQMRASRQCRAFERRSDSAPAGVEVLGSAAPVLG